MLILKYIHFSVNYLVTDIYALMLLIDVENFIINVYQYLIVLIF